MTLTATASTTQSMTPIVTATAVSSNGSMSICSCERTAPSSTSGSPNAACIAAIGSEPATSSEVSLSAIADGSGWNAPTWRWTSARRWSAMCGIENSVSPASSWEMTQSRISSRWIDQASANASIVAGTNTSEGVARGIGRSYTPNALLARLPTIDPTLMPSIAGAIILPIPAIIAAIGSSLARGGIVRGAE